VSVVLAALLLAPAMAGAGGRWTVRDAQGEKIGTARTVSSKKAIVVHGGERAGEINRTAPGKWTAYGFLFGAMQAVHIWDAARWGGSPPWQLRGFAELGPMPLMGRVIKREGRWLVLSGKRGLGWTTEGSMPASCPPWVAGGAVFLIQADTFGH